MKEDILKFLKKMKSFLEGDQEGVDLVNQLEEKISNQHSKVRPFWQAYTDGACRGNPGPGAWAGVVLDQSEEEAFECSGVEMSTTNNIMEMTAPLQTLRELITFLEDQNQSVCEATIKIHSDSKYVVDGMNSWIHNWKKRGWKKSDGKAPENLKLWMELDEIVQEYFKVEFLWVKAHDGDYYNEKVDGLCNLALDQAGF